MTGKCLGPEPGSPRSGGHVVEASCDGSLGQLWSLRDDGNGYVFQTIASRLCLDVMGSSRANGAKLITWKCTGASNQTWRYGSPIAP